MNEVLDMAPAQTAVATQQPRAVAAAPSGAVAPADLLRYALENGADLDRLEKLMELQQRY